eukprot:921280-Rhodomonas_salina.1
MVLRVCYAMPGTSCGYGPTDCAMALPEPAALHTTVHHPGALRHARAGTAPPYHPTPALREALYCPMPYLLVLALACYAVPTASLVLSERMLLYQVAEAALGALASLGQARYLPTKSAICLCADTPSTGIPRSAICLRARYAVPGTSVVTVLLHLMRCPVLTQYCELLYGYTSGSIA